MEIKWIDGSEISVSYDQLQDEVVINANREGLLSLAGQLAALADADAITVQVYRAHIALARFDEPTADRIMAELVAAHANDCRALFEAAQYCAKKCDYAQAIDFYERSFAAEPRRPRFQDELQGIADIYQIMGDYAKAAETYERIVCLLRDEWGMTEETELKHAQREKARLLEKAALA